MAKQKLTKSQRVEIARDKAAQMRARKAQEQKKQRVLVGIIVGIIVLAVVGLIVGIAIYRSSLPKDYSQSQGKDQDIATMKSLDHPAGMTDDGGILVGKDGLNKPTPGAIKVDNFSDFGCIACRVVDTKIRGDLEKYIQDGKINFIIHPVATPWLAKAFTDGYTSRMTGAALYIYQNDPEHFLDFFYGVFADESLPIDSKPDGSSAAYPFSDSDIQQLAAKLGVKPDVAAKCTDGQYKDYVTASAAYFSGLISGLTGVGTPYFLVNDERLPKNVDVLTQIKNLTGEAK